MHAHISRHISESKYLRLSSFHFISFLLLRIECLNFFFAKLWGIHSWVWLFFLFFRIILILWRILWTFLPSNGSWIQGSTKNPGSMWMMSGLCSTMRGYIIVRHPGCINFAVNSQRSLSKKSTLLCSLSDIAVDERYSISRKKIFFLG